MKLKHLRINLVVAIISVVLGLIISIIILQMYGGKSMEGHEASQKSVFVDAYFRDGKLVLLITNLEDKEIKLQMVFLESSGYMDFDMLVGESVAPGETKEIETDIMQPETSGKYEVRIRLTDGRIIETYVIVR